MAYSELIKNFEKIRAYMRDFYVYGFKSRGEYDRRSARSYDDERRRIESWLGDYMKFIQTPEGKNVFLSVDSRLSTSNPLYKALKTKSFTDGDITLHFILFDILYSPNIKKTIAEILYEIDKYLSAFDAPMTFDESNVRKKLKEYTELGIIETEKQGRKVLYSRTHDTDISELSDILSFFSEAAPCGAIGSFLIDKQEQPSSLFSFKHNYITQAIDSDVIACLFDAISDRCYITADNLSKGAKEPYTLTLVPLKIYISTQNGRQHLLAYREDIRRINSYRVDYLSCIRKGEPCEHFQKYRAELDEAEKHMWGVNCRPSSRKLEHVEFEIKVGEDEGFIVKRLERERRCGKIEQVDKDIYRFSADVFDTTELIPWIRTFISRITKMNFSDRTVENRFKDDILKMYRMYGIDGGDKA